MNITRSITDEHHQDLYCSHVFIVKFEQFYKFLQCFRLKLLYLLVPPWDQNKKDITSSVFKENVTVKRALYRELLLTESYLKINDNLIFFFCYIYS